MTMHLAHPSLTMTGKRKGKQKFASAEAKRKAYELAQDWDRKQKEWALISKPTSKSRPLTRPLPKLGPPPGRETPHYKSLDTWVTGAVTSKKSQVYTGDKIIGIGTLHKSNAVPIFTNQEAQDISKMRR